MYNMKRIRPENNISRVSLHPTRQTV